MTRQDDGERLQRYKRRPLSKPHRYMDHCNPEEMRDYIARCEATINSGRTISDDLAEVKHPT